MKTLYLDCGMGAAGDMLTAALLELMPDPDAFVEKLNSLGIPGVEFARESSVKCGITGTYVSVTVNGEEEGDEEEHEHEHVHEYEHEHVHHHHHHHHHESIHHHHHYHHHHDDDVVRVHTHEHAHHHHSSLEDIRAIVDCLPLSAKVAEDVMAVYSLIAEAESRAHGVPVTEIHFHEVGTMDAIADVTAVCLLIDELNPDSIVASPVRVGYGNVQCAHGVLPVPAPATASILQGIPIYSGNIEGEMCTPTGAALLRHFVEKFEHTPTMTVDKIGYGMGKKDFEAANCVRAMIGETEGSASTVSEMQCNLDDMTAEEIGFACERLFEAGALEVFTTPCNMKKSRPGTLLTVLCRNEDRERIVGQIFRLTETIGIRETEKRRYTLERSFSTAKTEAGDVRLKISEGNGAYHMKPEYDDLARIARERGISLREAKSLIDRD